MDKTKALRFNEGKPEMHYVLFFPRAIEALARVLEQGEKKYGYGNFTLGGKPDQEYLDSGLRHLFAHFKGELYDEDMGTLHLAHFLFNIMQLIEGNYRDVPLKDPGFDQEEFLERWKDMPKKDAWPR